MKKFNKKKFFNLATHWGAIAIGTAAGGLMRAGLANIVPIPEGEFNKLSREIGLFGVGLLTQKAVSEAVAADIDETVEAYEEAKQMFNN